MEHHDGDITPGMNTYYGEIETPIEPIVKKHIWGKNGTRYDEQCRRCRRTTQIDNDTELCRRCGTK